MKAIAIKQPWAQLVASGYKRIIHTSNLPFDVPERVLIYASGNDPLAENDGEMLPPLVRMQLENAKLLGYLTDDELPTRVLLGSVEVVGWNDRVGQSWKGVDEDGADSNDYLCLGDAQLFYDPIKLENVNGSRVFNVPSLSEDNLPDSFKLEKICRSDDVLSIPCTYDFAYDISNVQEYTYSLFLLYNNKFLLCDEVDNTVIPKETSYIVFNSPYSTHRFKVVKSTIEPSPFDESISQIVFTLRALDRRDYHIMPQPLQAMAEAIIRNDFPVKVYDREPGNFMLSQVDTNFPFFDAKPTYLCFYHKENQTVEVLFGSEISTPLTIPQQKDFLKKNVDMHFPFNVQWDGRFLHLCGIVYLDNGKLSEDVAFRFFKQISDAAYSLAEVLDLGF